MTRGSVHERARQPGGTRGWLTGWRQADGIHAVRWVFSSGAEGIATRADGGYWLVAEGNPARGLANLRPRPPGHLMTCHRNARSSYAADPLGHAT